MTARGFAWQPVRTFAPLASSPHFRPLGHATDSVQLLLPSSSKTNCPPETQEEDVCQILSPGSVSGNTVPRDDISDMLPRKYDLCHPISSTKHCCRVEKDDKCEKENFKNMIRVVATRASFWVQRRFIQGMRLRRSDQPHSVSVGWRCEKSTRTDFPEVIEWMWGPGNYVNTSWMQSLPDQEEFMSVVKSAWVGGPRTHRQHDHHRQLSCRVILASSGRTKFFRELDNLCRNDKIFPFRSRCLWRVLTRLWSSK